jgi:hypothetical protein
LDEDDEMNVDCDAYTKSPSRVSSNASRVSSSLPSPHVSSIVDSGCAPCHCAHPSIAHGPVRPSHRMVTTAHAAARTPVTEGQGLLLTRSARCPTYRLLLPGTTLFSPSFTYQALVSHHTLLSHGYAIDLQKHTGTITAPDGDVIRLRVCGGLYHFPPPASSVHPQAMPALSRRHTCLVGTPTPGEPSSLASIHEETMSPSLVSNLDKWDALHRTYGHPHRNRMLKIAKGMSSDDSHRPQLNTLKKWCELRPCSSCVTGAMRKPPQSLTHPPVPRDPSIRNGEGLHIDAMGAFSAPTHDTSTTAFLFTDDRSCVRVAFPTPTKSCEALLQCVQDYVASSRTPLKFIRTDNEFLCEPLVSWCRTHGVALSACAPHTHIQNPKAERSVGLVKDLARKNKHLACTSDFLLGYNYVYSCQALNRQPTDADPDGLSRSPLQIWPTAPFQHPSQHLVPWGCRTFGFVGKVTSAPNTGVRSRPGIFVGHAHKTSGYQIYHPDSDTICVWIHTPSCPCLST